MQEGEIFGSGDVTLPGIAFFVNEAPKLTSRLLRDNTGYATAEEIDLAMPTFDRPGDHVWNTSAAGRK